MSDTIDLVRKELLLCGVKEGTTIAVLSEVDRLAEYAAGFLAAAQALGGPSFGQSGRF
jgi:hypothetical protein